jgi:hypothetical protein
LIFWLSILPHCLEVSGIKQVQYFTIPAGMFMGQVAPNYTHKFVQGSPHSLPDGMEHSRPMHHATRGEHGVDDIVDAIGKTTPHPVHEAPPMDS